MKAGTEGQTAMTDDEPYDIPKRPLFCQRSGVRCFRRPTHTVPIKRAEYAAGPQEWKHHRVEWWCRQHVDDLFPPDPTIKPWQDRTAWRDLAGNWR